MSPQVAQCFKRIIQNRKIPVSEPVIDGYKKFLFLDKNDMPMVALHWEKYFKHILDKYNAQNKVKLPKITPHVCRHTFCSNMAKKGINPKMLQYVMGHAEVSLTLSVYTHINIADAQTEFDRVLRA